MKNFTEFLDFVALFVQITGTYVMYKNSPDNKPEGALITYGTDLETPKKKNNKFRQGFKILGIGFGIQLISMIIKLFFC